jgi:hypothetical protein
MRSYIKHLVSAALIVATSLTLSIGVPSAAQALSPIGGHGGHGGPVCPPRLPNCQTP